MTEEEKELVKELCLQVKYETAFEGSPVFPIAYENAVARVKAIKEELGIE